MNKLPINIEDANNPYIIVFDPKSSQNAAEAHQAPVYLKDRLPHEWEVIREERLTYFEYDEIIREIFHNNFEEYMKAADYPEYMIQKIREYQKERGIPIPVFDIFTMNAPSVPYESAAEWDAHPLHNGNAVYGGSMNGVGAVEDMYDLVYQAMGGFGEGASPRFKKESDLWQKAYLWAASALSAVQYWYYDKKIKDKDIFRVHVNGYLMLVKIGIALISEEILASPSIGKATGGVFDKSLSNQILKMFHLARVYLLKSMESLAAIKNKEIVDAGLVQTLISLSEILLQALNKKIGGTKKF